jgi:hypothetical protein
VELFELCELFGLFGLFGPFNLGPVGKLAPCKWNLSPLDGVTEVRTTFVLLYVSSFRGEPLTQLPLLCLQFSWHRRL